MKNKKGFTLVEVIVSVALIMVVVFYLLRSIITVSNKNNDLVTRQEFSVYENNLLKSFYDDTIQISNTTEIGTINRSESDGVYIIEYPDLNNVRLVIDPIQSIITYDNVVYRLPENVTFSPKNGRYYDFDVIKRQKDKDDTYGIIVTNIYLKVNDTEEVVKLMYQGILKTHQVSFYKNLNPSSDTDQNEKPYITTSVVIGTDLTSFPDSPINDNEPDRAFSGWYTSRTGGNEVGLPYTITNNISLYAHWGEKGANIYYVQFDGNGATSGSMAKQTLEVGKNLILNKNKFVKTGYTFMGWNTKANGSGTSYADQATVKDLTTKNNTISLYAQWGIAPYNVSLDKQGGTGGTNAIYEKYNQGFYKDSSATNKMTTSSNPINKPSKSNNTFGGYYTGQNCSGEKYIGENGYLTSSAKPSNFNSDGTLYACWKSNNTPEPDPVITPGAQTYTVKYNSNGGTGTMADSTFERGKSYNLRANSFTRTGYTFTGWNTNANGNGTGYLNQASISNLASANGTITLYAQWIKDSSSSDPGNTETTYTIKYSCGEGTGTPPSNQTVKFGNTFKVAENTCSKSGSTFAGWFDSTGEQWYSGQTYTWDWTNGEYGISNNSVTLIAKWNSNSTPTGQTYSITFNCQSNGSNPPSKIDNIKIGDSVNLSGKKCTANEGYEFSGWRDQPASGNWWTNWSGTWNYTKSYTLYAQYNLKTSKITYSCGSTSSQTFTYGQTNAKIAGLTCSKTGYKQTGWTTNSNGTNDGQGWTGWSGTWRWTNDYYLYPMWTADSSSGGGSDGGTTSGCKFKYSKSNNPCLSGWSYSQYTNGCHEYCSFTTTINKGASTIDQVATNFQNGYKNSYGGKCIALTKTKQTGNNCTSSSCPYTFSCQLQ